MKWLRKKVLWKHKVISVLMISLNLDHFLPTFYTKYIWLTAWSRLFYVFAFWRGWKWAYFPHVYWFSENNTCRFWWFAGLVPETELASFPHSGKVYNHSSILAWRIPWTEEPGCLWPMGSQRVGHGWRNRANTHLNLCYCGWFHWDFLNKL